MEANLINNLEAEDTMMACVKYKNKVWELLRLLQHLGLEIMRSITISGDTGFIKIGGIALNEIIDYSFTNKDAITENIINNSSEKVSSGYGIATKKLLKTL